MKLLLDTHLVLSAAGDRGKLASEARELIDDAENELFFSAAGLWDVAIKSGLDRDDFFVDVRLLRRGLLDDGYSELPIASEHAVAISGLPAIHKDPFDRMLIAQEMADYSADHPCDHGPVFWSGPDDLVG